ncbi:hypothetical protein RFI_23915 [Reticulomyxa filosa]|uniref:Uncharacterized protein n=1 Tax=Reticulomyxa filosa TaxID=46433 RepID=X6MHH8_RETFI|nr:hypothetical protein RFI_23915 [Reticulomyxa filosa]|eukprot:ETO13453.1 hypothetical protein RFI_23915 [Reticulomyxa filosa]
MSSNDHRHTHKESTEHKWSKSNKERKFKYVPMEDRQGNITMSDEKKKEEKTRSSCKSLGWFKSFILQDLMTDITQYQFVLLGQLEYHTNTPAALISSTYVDTLKHCCNFLLHFTSLLIQQNAYEAVNLLFSKKMIEGVLRVLFSMYYQWLMYCNCLSSNNELSAFDSEKKENESKHDSFGAEEKRLFPEPTEVELGSFATQKQTYFVHV